MSNSNMLEIDNEEMEEEKELYETMKCVMMTIQVIIFMLHELIVNLSSERVHCSLNRRPKTSSGYNYIHKILNDDPDEFRGLYRMYPNIFVRLCDIIREKTLLNDTRFICVEEMLAAFFRVVGQNSRYSIVREPFRHSHFTASQNFNKILKVLNKLAIDMMAKPASTAPEKIRESTRFYPYFKDCVGAIDGTHIPAMVTGRDTSSYHNRHGTISQNVLAACDFNLNFIYVLSGWEGSAHDSKVLSDALSRRNGLKVPQGKFFLVDCGFPNRRQFLAPFRGVRYHLQDFVGRGRDPENAKELFNLRHASLRNVVERIFGIFKSRFTIFITAPPFPYKTQAELVLACAGLHNFLRNECRSDEFPVEPKEDEELGDEDNNEELFFESQEQQRDNANQWRNTIATDMWSDVEH